MGSHKNISIQEKTSAFIAAAMTAFNSSSSPSVSGVNTKGREKGAGLIFSTALLLVILLVGGCSGAPPEVSQLFWQLNVVEDPETSEQYEELTVFVHIDDPDGVSDIEELEILHTTQELLWKFTPPSWRKVERDGETWFGSNGVRSGFSELVPRGEYRVRVGDKAGESVETDFVISPEIIGLQRGAIKSSSFPNLSITPDQIELSSSSPELLISLYDEKQNFIKSEIITFNEEQVSIKKPRNNWEGVQYVWIQEYHGSDGYGLVRGPYSLNSSD